MRHALRRALDSAATAEHLTVVCDLDGTLAEIVADPGAIRPSRTALEALGMLARQPGTRVVVLSGRTADDLAHHARVDGVRLAGDHGLDQPAPRHPAADRDLERFLARFVAPAVGLYPGVRLERKPAGTAVHARGVTGGRTLLELLEQRVEREPRLHALPGKAVLEISTRRYDKGAALARLRAPVGPVVFLGDDVTDERAFAALGPGDVGVKVGPGTTAAPYRVPGPRAAGRWLQRLARRRSRRV